MYVLIERTKDGRPGWESAPRVYGPFDTEREVEDFAIRSAFDVGDTWYVELHNPQDGRVKSPILPEAGTPERHHYDRHSRHFGISECSMPECRAASRTRA